MSRVGFDYVCVDTQHGNIEYQMAAEMIRAIEYAGTTPIVRVPWNEPGIIGKMLDAGAHGYLLKHIDPEALLDAVRTASAGNALIDPQVGRLLLDNRDRATAHP